MSFTSINAFQHTAGYSVARPVPPTITAAAFGTLTALGQIPITGIVYNSTTSYYNILVNGSAVATNQTASSYTYSGGLSNNVQYGPFTVVPYTASGVVGTPFTVTGGSGGGRIYTWAYAGTLSFSGTSSSGTTLNFTGQALSSAYITYTPTAGVTPVSGTKTSTLPVAFSGMTTNTPYTFTVYPVNGDNVPGSASGTNTGTGSVTTLPPTLWASAGSGGIAYSTNAVNWTVSPNNNSTFGQAIGVAYGKTLSGNVGLWVAVGLGAGGNTIGYSTNALNWTGLGKSLITGNGGAVGYGGIGIFVASGYQGVVSCYSTNGVTWSATIGSISNGVNHGISYCKNIWISGGYQSPPSSYSVDGYNWSGYGTGGTTSIFNNQGGYSGYGLTPNGDIWVAAGAGTSTFQLYYSTNAANWTGAVCPFSIQGNSAAYNTTLKIWVASGNSNSGGTGLCYSSNAVNWTGISGIFRFVSGVVYSASQNIFGANGYYSTNGVNWTGVSSLSAWITCNQ
jgi:hypothetical protein